MLNHTKHEITKEEYNRMKELSLGELSKEIKATLDSAIIEGYGYYGAYLTKDDKLGKYYYVVKSGSSCD